MTKTFLSTAAVFLAVVGTPASAKPAAPIGGRLVHATAALCVDVSCGRIDARSAMRTRIGFAGRRIDVSASSVSEQGRRQLDALIARLD